MPNINSFFDYTPSDLLNDLRKEAVIFQSAPVDKWLEWASAFNECRLYWVWAGSVGVLGKIVDLLPDDFFNKLQAAELLAEPTPFMTSLGWILYYLRFAVTLNKALNPEQNEENPLPWQEKVIKQLDELKFSLINDLVWATGNLLCFFWLVGEASVYGDMLTAVLLLMDVSLSIWNYWEQKAQATQALQAAPNAVAARDAKLYWDYELYSLFSECLYAATLCFAFSMVCCFFIPLAHPLMLEVTGTLLCFAFNALFAAINKGLTVCKSVQLLNNTNSDQQDILQNYLTLNNDIARENAYFNLLSLQLWAEYHQQMITYQKNVLLRSVLIDVFVPPAVFLALVFLPYTLALPALFVGYIWAVAAYYQIERNYKVDEPLPLNMDDPMLQAPLPDEMIEKIIRPKIVSGFFNTAANYLQTAPTIPINAIPLPGAA